MALSYILGKHSKLSLEIKLLLSKTLLMSIWTNDIQLWGTTKKSNVYKIQTFQSIALHIITNTPFYISNNTLHTDLKINIVDETAKIHYKHSRSRLTHHPHSLISALNSDTNPGNLRRRRKIRWCWTTFKSRRKNSQIFI